MVLATSHIFVRSPKIRQWWTISTVHARVRYTARCNDARFYIMVHSLASDLRSFRVSSAGTWWPLFCCGPVAVSVVPRPRPSTVNANVYVTNKNRFRVYPSSVYRNRPTGCTPPLTGETTLTITDREQQRRDERKKNVIRKIRSLT